jgi:hypothetical protein
MVKTFVISVSAYISKIEDSAISSIPLYSSTLAFFLFHSYAQIPQKSAFSTQIVFSDFGKEKDRKEPASIPSMIMQK